MCARVIMSSLCRGNAARGAYISLLACELFYMLLVFSAALKFEPSRLLSSAE
jgi:hypothetical protein